MRAQGATALFIPTNNSAPKKRTSPVLNEAARSIDIALAAENRAWVIRADVAARNDKLSCFGCFEIVSPHGNVIQEAHLHEPDLLVADLEAVNND